MFELTKKQISSLEEFLTKMLKDKGYDEWHLAQKKSSEEMNQILEDAEFESGNDLSLGKLYKIGDLILVGLGSTALTIAMKKGKHSMFETNNPKNFNVKLRSLLFSTKDLAKRVDGFVDLNYVGVQTVSQFLCKFDPKKHPFYARYMNRVFDFLAIDEKQLNEARIEATNEFDLGSQDFHDRTIEYFTNFVILRDIKNELKLKEYLEVQNLLWTIRQWIKYEKPDLNGNVKTEKRKLVLREAKIPIEEKYVTEFLRVLACSPPTPFQIETLRTLHKSDKIIYNTEFQRGEVWDTQRKQKLIDSILRGYSINTIFLRQLPDGKHECLDGQQRLKTLFKGDGESNGFLVNGFPINPSITPEFNRETYFDELPEPLKSKILSYIVYAIIIYTDKDEETCRIFLRLQEGLPLNSAEKINAMIGFLRNDIVELAKHPFMKKIGINDYRFAHRYMVAQAYLLALRNHTTDVKFRQLEEIYQTYKHVRPHPEVGNSLAKTFSFLEKEFGDDAQTIDYRADLITLYLLGKHIRDNYVTAGKVGLKDFFIEFEVKVGEVESSEQEKDAPYYDYQTYRRTSADGKTSIDKRFEIMLAKFLEYRPNLVPKDPNRGFDDWERLAIFWRDKGVCKLCGKKTPFNKGTTDHIKAHSKGGQTIIDNGQWVCLPCNLRKLDKFDLSTPFAVQKEVYTLSTDILRLMGDCNNICQSKSKDQVFKITNKVLGRIADIEKAVKTKDEFGNLTDALYEIIYEGSGSLNRIPESFKKEDFIGFSIKFIRNDLRHDLEHGEEKEIVRKKTNVAKIYKKYTGKTTMSSLKGGDLQKIQIGFLKELKSFLDSLKQQCINS
jgi:hypothetical protein